MVFAPHQDDEALHCAGVLRKAAMEGARICVCFVTNGEYEREDFAKIRSEESLQALKKLGVPEESAVFLGYADTGMPPGESFLYRLFQDKAGITLASRYGKRETWLPDGKQEYRFQKDGTHSPYTRAAVLGDLSELMAEFQPDEVFVTAPCDLHGDHAAIGAFVSEAIQGLLKEGDLSHAPRLYHYLVHTTDEQAWPPRSGVSFPEPPDSAALSLDWSTHETRKLPDGFTAADKRALFFTYASQDPTAYGDYLLAFAKEEELFFRADPMEPVQLPAI